MYLTKNIMPFFDTILQSYSDKNNEEMEFCLLDIKIDFRKLGQINEELYKDRSATKKVFETQHSIKKIFEIMQEEIQRSTKNFTFSDTPSQYMPFVFKYTLNHLKKYDELYPQCPVTATIFNNNVCFYLYYEMFDGFHVLCEKNSLSYDYLFRLSTIDIPYIECLIKLSNDVAFLK